MLVNFQFHAQLRLQAGKDSVEVEVPEGAALAEAIEALRPVGMLGEVLFTRSGLPSPSVLYFLDDQQVDPKEFDRVLKDGATITVLSPISGG